MSRRTHHLSARSAIGALPPGDTVHVFSNPSGGVMVGFDLARDEVEKMIRDAALVEVGGPACKSMGHGIAVWISDTECQFIQSREGVDLEALPDKDVEEAVFAERKRCLDIVDNYYDGAPDAGSVPMSSVGSMIAQIRGEP